MVSEGRREERSTGLTPIRTTRRTMVRGAAWSVPLVTVAAPAAYAGPSQCTVVDSVQVGPLVPMTVRAICTAQSQFLNPGTLMANYASGSLPAYLEICNCQNADAWYRWQEVDDLSEFQIEVDGVHIDQNSPAAGWRSPFFLPGFGQTGGCKRFALTYRTSLPRPTTATFVTITFTLQTATSSTGPWTTLTTAAVTGSITRNPGTGPAAVDFDTCSAGGTARTQSGSSD